MRKAIGRDIPDYFNNDHLKNHLGRRAVRGGGISIISRIAGFALQLLGLIVLARLLSPGDFGLVAMVTVITEVFFVFKDLGLSYATIQEPRIDHEQISTLFWINFAFGVTVALLIILISPAVALFYKQPQLQLITIVSSANFLFIGISTQHLALLKRNMSFVSLAIIEIVASFASTALAIYCAWIGWGYWALVARPLILGLLTTLGAWFFCRWRPGRPVRNSGAWPMLKFGAHTLVFYLFDYITMNMDKVMIGRRYGADHLGYYQRAVYISKSVSNTLTLSLTNVAVATLSKLRDAPDQYRRYYLKALAMISFIGMPLSVLMFMMSKDIVYVVLGPRWDETAAIFSVLGISTGIYLISNTNGWLHLSLGRSDRLMKWGMISAAVVIASVFIGLPFGARGVAIAYTAATFLLAFPSLLYAGKPIKLSFMELLSGLWRFFSAAIAAGFFCKYWIIEYIEVDNAMINLFSGSIVYALIYVALLTLFFKGPKPILEYIMVFKKLKNTARGEKAGDK